MPSITTYVPLAEASAAAGPGLMQVTAALPGLTGLGGRAALIGVLLVAATAGWGLARRRAGTFRAARRAPAAAPAAAGGPTVTAPTSQVITAGDLDLPLGERATFVQFSTSTCATCPQVRRALQDVATREAGVAHVEVDAERSMDLVRRLRVLRTPTVLLVDGHGVVRSRTSGPVTAAQAAAALDDLTPLTAPVAATTLATTVAASPAPTLAASLAPTLAASLAPTVLAATTLATPLAAGRSIDA